MRPTRVTDCCRQNHADIALMLVNKGANLFQLDAKGCTRTCGKPAPVDSAEELSHGPGHVRSGSAPIPRSSCVTFHAEAGVSAHAAC